MRMLSLLLGAVLMGATATGQQSGKVTGSGTIEYLQNDKLVPIPITIQSIDQEIDTIVKRAFRLHGGFNMVATNQADFTLRFVKRSGSTVLLTILQNRNGGSPQSFPVKGRDIRHAALLAADIAVEKITARPGFFAGKMVFVSHTGKIRELYTSDLFFQGFDKLTSHRYQVVAPDWSPDGSKIMYSSNHKGGLDIYMLDVASKVSSPIARYRGQNLGAVFGPHGRRAAMILNRELFIQSAILNPNSKPERITRNRSAETSPTWSPNGRQLIVSSDVQGGGKLYEVILAGRNLGRLRPITTTIKSREMTEPSWNPLESNLIAFSASIQGYSQIAIHDLKTGKSELLSSNTNDEGPCWTNDGRHLLFSSQRGGKHQLKILDTWTNTRKELHVQKGVSFSSPDFVYPNLR